MKTEELCNNKYVNFNSIERCFTRSVAYAGFFNGGGSVTSHRDDVKILRYNYSSLEVLKCIVL